MGKRTKFGNSKLPLGEFKKEGEEVLFLGPAPQLTGSSLWVGVCAHSVTKLWRYLSHPTAHLFAPGETEVGVKIKGLNPTPLQIRPATSDHAP